MCKNFVGICEMLQQKFSLATLNFRDFAAGHDIMILKEVLAMKVSKVLALVMVLMMFSVSSAEPMRVKISAEEYVLTATLNDNAGARAFWEKLPLTVSMQNLYGREMCYRFGAGTLPEGDVAYAGYDVDDLSYWPPRGSLVILYEQNGEVFEQVKLGHIDGDVSFFAKMGTTKIKFERAK